ncbi:MAG: oxygen-binding di-iron domain-containing protein [Acidimicrobiia bacterium]
MGFAPQAPTVRQEPEQVAPDTWVIHSVQEATGAPLLVHLNSMVIRGEEPVIIDTNTPANREQWLEDVFGLVDPEDVRWVFLSHDDVDHTGNLDIVMERCPNATLVSSWAITERHTNAFDFPLDRCRWVNDGDEFSVGDRTLRAVRPPLYDSPTTRGLFDEKTGVYWAVDSFACPMPGAIVESAADFDAEHWRMGMTMFMYHALAPWLSIVDPARYAESVQASRSLGMSTITSAHSPVIPESKIDDAYELILEMPSIAPPPCPDHSVLQAVLGTG